MAIREKDIREFMEIWKNDFGYELSMDDARAKASLLIHFYLELSKPLPSEMDEGLRGRGDLRDR